MGNAIQLSLGAFSAAELLEGSRPLPTTIGLRLNVEGFSELHPQMSETQMADYQRAAGGFIGVTLAANGEPVLLPDLLGLRPLYFTPGYVADRFLLLVDKLRAAGEILSFNPRSVAHFVEYGYTEPGHTLIKTISRVRVGEGLILREGQFQRLPLNPSTLAIEPRRAGDAVRSRDLIRQIGDHLKSIVQHIDLPASVDLTGGVDSRILAILAAGNPNIAEAACSHYDSESAEIKLGQAVAARLGLAYHLAVAPNRMTFDDLKLAFEYVDAHGLLVHAHRHRTMQQARAERGVKVSVSGQGGECYKDFWWLQDFPFYRRARPNLEKLVRLRINPLPVSREVFSDRYREALTETREAHLSRLRAMTDGLSNTSSYDQIYYFEKMAATPIPFCTGGALVGIAVVMPLLNRLDVGRSFILARRHRMMNYAHRLIVAWNCHREIGSIRTTDGISLRPGWLGVASDLGAWTGNLIVRLTKKIVQQLFRVTVFEPTANSPSLEQDLSRLLGMLGVLDALKAQNIISAEVKEIDELGVTKLNHWGCIGLLAKRLESAVGVSRRPDAARSHDYEGVQPPLAKEALDREKGR